MSDEVENGSHLVKQVLIRALPEEHERWKAAAERRGLTLTDFIREHANAGATSTLDCQHPIERRRVYPWSDVCLACGVRLRG